MPVNVKQNGWLNTRLVMRQKDRQETSGTGKPGALEATYHSVNKNHLHSLGDSQRGPGNDNIQRVF